MMSFSNKWYIPTVLILLALGWLKSDGKAQINGGLVLDLAYADLTFIGEDEGDWTAYFASAAGDVNGDGLGDVIIGAPMAGNKECPVPDQDPCLGLAKGEGTAYLILGKERENWASHQLNLADADASFLGCENASMTARQLYTAGDVNNDGYDDFLISGWKCGEEFTGKTYLFLGRPDIDYWGMQFPVEQADAIFLGEHTFDFASYYVSTAGDVNGDGYDDILISSTHNDEAAEDAGQVYLVLGRADEGSPDYDPSRPWWAPDFLLTNADASFHGEAEGDRLGRAVTGVGDVNNDGFDDFLLGSIHNDFNGIDAGQNYLFLGRPSPDDPGYDVTRPWWGKDASVGTADASFVGEAAGDEAGRRVARAGDVNNDGFSDFIIGAALNDTGGPDAGKAYLILGRASGDWGELPVSLANADASFYGEIRRDQAGRRVSGAGDFNHDGYDDFLIGAPHHDEPNEEGEIALWAEGKAYLIFGRPAADWGTNYSLAAADVIFIGKPEIGAAGYDVAWIGDYDGDQIDDLLIAAYGGRNNNEVPGEAYLISGTNAPMPFNFLPDAHSGIAGKWGRFTAHYWDFSGWQDIEKVHLVLERASGTPTRVEVTYQPGSEQIYLLNNDGSGWLGPCTLGDMDVLSNGIVEIDCYGSSVLTESEFLRVMWRIRWDPGLGDKQTYNVYLRAISNDQLDSGYKQFGLWMLNDIKYFFMLITN